MPRYRQIDNSQANRNLVNANIKLVDENKDIKDRVNRALDFIQDIEKKFYNQEFIGIDKKLVDIDYIKQLEKILKGVYI